MRTRLAALAVSLILAALAVSLIFGCSPKSDYEVCIEKTATHLIESQGASRHTAESTAAKFCARWMYGDD